MSDLDAVDEHDLIVIKGLCCCNTALYPAIPECCGCSSKSEACCLVTQCCLKLGTPTFGCKALGEDACLQCGCCCCAIGLKSPSVLCKSQKQVCCIVANAAFPTDEEVPAVLACFCLQCYPHCGCCQRLKMRVPKYVPMAAPAAGQMDRAGMA